MNVIVRLQSLRHREHTATVELIEALVECHRTRAYLPAGHASVWALLVDRLKYSPAAASRRTAAMKFALRSSRVLDMLRTHRTSLSALAKVVSLLEQDVDVESLLDAIDGRTQVEVEAIVASLRPRTKPVERVRRVAVAASPVAEGLPLEASPYTPVSRECAVAPWPASSAAELPAEPLRSDSAAEVPNAATVADPDPADEPPRDEPVTATPEPRVALSFSVSEEDFAAFERARTILSRKLPKGVTLEDALNELVAFFLERKAPDRKSRRKSASESSKRIEPNSEPSHPPTPRTRHVPRAIRDQVARRDGERCTFVAPDGTRCSSTHDLEIDHVVPYALGGTHEPDNLRVLCAKHNRWRAEQTFGARVPQRNSKVDRALDSR